MVKYMCRRFLKNNKGENTMAAVTNEYVYSVKAKKTSEKKIPVIDRKKIEKFQKMLSKYSDNK